MARGGDWRFWIWDQKYLCKVPVVRCRATKKYSLVCLYYKFHGTRVLIIGSPALRFFILLALISGGHPCLLYFLNGRSQDDPNFVANQSQVTPAPVAVSSDLSAILEAQKNSILAALNSQIKDLRTSLLKAQSDFASLIASEVQDSYVCKKRGNEQQCRLSRRPTQPLVRPWRVATSPKLRRNLLKVFLYLLIGKRSLS